MRKERGDLIERVSKILFWDSPRHSVCIPCLAVLLDQGRFDSGRDRSPGVAKQKHAEKLARIIADGVYIDRFGRYFCDDRLLGLSSHNGTGAKRRRGWFEPT